MKTKIKYANVTFINPDVSSGKITYIIPRKNFSSKEKAVRYLNKKFGLANIENCITDYEISDEMIKEFVGGNNND